MENLNENISPELIGWIKEILNSKETDLFLLYTLKDIGKIPKEVEIKINPTLRHRNTVIEKTLGYIHVLNEEESISDNILAIASKLITTKSCTIKGLVNFMFLISRLGNISDTKRSELKKEFYNQIPSDLYLAVVDELIVTYNKEFHFSNLKSEEPLNLKDWEHLFFSLQYMDRFDNPIGLLRGMLLFRINELPILNLLVKILPDPRAALFEYGFELNHLKEKTVLDFLKSNPNEIPFFAFLAIEQQNTMPSYLGKEIVSLFIVDNWNNVGKYLFRKMYSNNKKNINENTQTLLINEIDLFFKDEFSNNNPEKTIITNFLWPDDYFAFGGWLLNLHEDSERSSISFNSAFKYDLFSSFTKHVKEIENNLSSYIYDSGKSYNIWFRDIFDLRAQYCTGYIMWTLLIADKNSYDSFLLNFKSLCFAVKEQYYGSYQANNLAQKISNYLLCFLLSYPMLTEEMDEKLDRLKELLNIFNSIIGFQWVLYTERNDLIWNNNMYKPNYSDTELVFILNRLKEIPNLYLAIVTDFKNTILRLSTIKWPF